MAIYVRKFPGLNEFHEEIQKESDRGAALLVGSLLDERLASLLKAFFIDSNKLIKDLVDSPNAPLGTFSARISTAHALGLLDKAEYDIFNTIRKIRNKFAHQWQGLSFNNASVDDLCRTLPWCGWPAHEEQSTPRQRFDYMGRELFREMLAREELVKNEKRITKDWPCWEDLNPLPTGAKPPDPNKSE